VAVSAQDGVLNRWRATRLVDTVSSIKSGAWGREPVSGGTLCIRIADFNTDNRSVVFKSRTLREIEKATLSELLLKSGDLLVEKSGGGDKVPVGRIVMWQSDEEAITSNFISRIRLKSEYLPSFMSRVFQIQYVSGLSRKWLKQSTGIQNLDLANYLRETVHLPDLSEQLLLSRYLDHAELRIAKAIQAKQKMVALLNEQKQVIISELVTRGLNPDVPMKDSGQAWLGQMPAHWELVPVRAALQKNKRIVGIRKSDFQLLSLTKQGVIVRNLVGMKGKFPASFDSYQEVSSGDFIFCLFDVDETPRAVGLSSHRGMITGAYDVLTPTGYMHSSYLLQQFLTFDNHKLLKPLYRGLRKTIPMPWFLGMKIACPPKDEQVHIAEKIVSRTESIDKAVAALLNEINLLKEYRTVLISDVVTGKKDVRAEAASLPDLDPAELAYVLSGAVSVDGEEDEVDGASEAE
jgi:type I restriction enzyme S subunit